ncbi:hypothetical protein V6N13_063697 [Hibiscus sabdariffa]
MVNQTIRELAASPAVQQPFCITFPQGEMPFQLKTGLIHFLPTFHGLPNESPHKHLYEFHLVCSSMKPQGVSENQIKLRAFPFSLSGIAIAKEWLFYLSPNSITTWTELKSKFLDRFFPVAKASEIRRSIIAIKQKHEESLYEYWERYKKLCASCPQHGLSDHTLIQYFYEGLLPMEMKMIDATSGGALFNMTPTQARELISTMAANSQQFGSTSEPNRWVHEEETLNAIGNFPGPAQRPYNPHKHTYNPGWRDHPNLSYAPNLTYQPRPPQSYQPPHKPSLENLVEQLAQSQVQFQNRTESHLQELDKHVSQLAPLGVIVERLAQTEDDATTQKENSIPEPEQSPYAEPPPFTARFIKKDNQAEEKEILDIFQKVEISLPLLEVIRKVPRYARFLKNLCTNKRKLFGHEKLNLGEHVSAVLSRQLPLKLKDQGMFTIPCKIGKVGIKRAMCELGASINVMPLSVYNTLSAHPLKETRVIVQLADRTVICPEGVLENVLVKVRSGLLTMEFDGEIAKFNVYKAMRIPENVQSVNFVGFMPGLISLGRLMKQQILIERSCTEAAQTQKVERGFSTEILRPGRREEFTKGLRFTQNIPLNILVQRACPEEAD